MVGVPRKAGHANHFSNFYRLFDPWFTGKRWMVEYENAVYLIMLNRRRVSRLDGFKPSRNRRT